MLEMSLLKWFFFFFFFLVVWRGYYPRYVPGLLLVLLRNLLAGFMGPFELSGIEFGSAVYMRQGPYLLY